MIAAAGVDGRWISIVYNLSGSITSEIMEDFIEYKVLPYCNPFPASNSVSVLDNASIHRSYRLRRLCEEAGVMLYFLPPYSPDYNLIEKTFKHLKSWINRIERWRSCLYLFIYRSCITLLLLVSNSILISI